MSTNDVANSPTIDRVEAHFEGIEDRGSEKKVAVAINVNFELKDGQKERGHSVSIHVIPLLRRMYANGVVKPLAKWPRNISRTVELTQSELKRELETLISSFGQKKPGQVASILAEVYGATEADQLRNLRDKMVQVWHAWARLERLAMSRLPKRFPGQTFSPSALHGVLSEVITDDEINDLVKIIEPEREELEEIQLPELEAIGSAPTDDDATVEGGTDEDATAWLTTELETQIKMSQQDALEFTAMVIEGGDVDPEPQRMAMFKALQKADKTLHQKKGEQVLRLVKLYREKVAKSATSPV